MGIGARYHMLCFSDRPQPDWVPRRLSQAEISASFGDGWEVESIEDARLDVTVDPGGAEAWLASIRRRREPSPRASESGVAQRPPDPPKL
jgi:hypothetical protein